MDVSEENHTPFNDDNYQFYGPYGFGHFLECFDNPDGFTDACRMKQVHIDPGAVKQISKSLTINTIAPYLPIFCIDTIFFVSLDIIL